MKRRIPRIPFRPFLLAALMAALLIRPSVAAEPPEEVYPELKTFTEVLSLVEKNYVEQPGGHDLVLGAIRGMLRSLDPHSSFMTAEQYREMQVDTSGQFGGLGIQIGVKDDTLTVIAPIEDTPAERAGIQAGDRIVKIEGNPTKGISLQEAVTRLRGPKGSDVTITVFRESDGKFRDVTITRDIIQVKSVKHKTLEKTVGYVRLSQFQERTADDLKKALKKLKKEGAESLILDLRNNPGGLLNSSVDVADQFLDPDQLVVYTKDRSGKRTEYRNTGRYASYDWPMVVLVNAGSASASEIVAGAMKDHQRAVILGTRTFGKGSVQTVIPLSDGSGLRLTTSRYYTPADVSIQNTGIDPHIEVPLEGKNGTRGHAVVREKDLEGHLENDQKTAEPEEGMEEIMPFQLKEQEDNQLQRAVDLLKGLMLIQGGPKKG